MDQTLSHQMPEPETDRVATEEDVKVVKNMIKKCISSKNDEGVTSEELRALYQKMTGTDIPYISLGYNSLFHLIRDMPEIKHVTNKITYEHVLVLQPGEDYIPLPPRKESLQTRFGDLKTYKPRRSARVSEWKNRQKLNREKSHDRHRNFSGSTISDYEFVFPPVDENWDPPHFVHPSFHKERHCSTPIIGGRQLIGDDFLLQLCIKYLNDPLVRANKNSAISCGTVKSGMTIRKATEMLDDIHSMSNKILINVGTQDIYKRRDAADMLDDYEALLDKLQTKYGYSPHQITICTLPPLGNIGVSCHSQQFRNHARFNLLLKFIASNGGYRFLDVHNKFTKKKKSIIYDYFQDNAFIVSGTKHPYVLWNYAGRQRMMELLLNL